MDKECFCCGWVDEHYDEGAGDHDVSEKHKCNMILYNFTEIKKSLYAPVKDGVSVSCTAETRVYRMAPINTIGNCSKKKISICAQPGQKVDFTFIFKNDMRDEGVRIVGVQLGHPQPQFEMHPHPYDFGENQRELKSKSSIREAIQVTFTGGDVGQYEMPITFTFSRTSNDKMLIFVRDMVVIVQEDPNFHMFPKTPYKNEIMDRASEFVPSTDHRPYEITFKIPVLLKKLLPYGLSENTVQKSYASPEMKAEMRECLIRTKAIIAEKITKENYIDFFQLLLWWEETIARIKLKRYNMTDVTINRHVDNTFWLEVPGLAEKRPSLLRGDRAYVTPYSNSHIVFESIIDKISENSVQLGKFDGRFYQFYCQEERFHVRFMMSRVPMERMHLAVTRTFTSGHGCRVFPEPTEKPVNAKRIKKFYNDLIPLNKEQKSAVEHIVSNTSGKAPYIVFGPPGTGKTMTIVEAILQIVAKSPNNRVMVCTDSNMAADHIAVTLLRYSAALNITHFLFRANSKTREWTILPPELAPVSNGTNQKNFYPIDSNFLAKYKVVVATLMHSAKYSLQQNQTMNPLQVSHLFIDEAAQAKEPAALVPITGLLAPSGQLVLAGDPKQLGPVCMSRQAKDHGLGTSLLERLWRDYKNLYAKDPNYITILVKNFRSDPDILRIPNKLIYKEHPLQPCAQPDPLSKVNILGKPGDERAVVFHAVNSKEQKMGNAPSYFNEKELTMLQRYTTALIMSHGVLAKDIGIIAPYIRQVYKMRDWLKTNNYEEVEIGTVESFQGKEKRVILVSTVRANCKLLDYDAKYGLGFLVDDKRFNVALTRAKAKLIIIGNPACLTRDIKWREYMDFCKECNTYNGHQYEQMKRDAPLLKEIAKTRFDRSGITQAMREKQSENREK